MIGTSVCSYALVCCIFDTFISNFNSPTYKSGAFQLNAGYLRAGLLCLGLWATPALGILGPDASPEPSSFSAIITTTVAAWIATCMIAVCIASDSVISACILYNILPSLDYLHLPS